MSSITYVGRRMQNFDSAQQHDGFSKVVIVVSNEVEYSAGVETGKTLTLECPWGSQEMADNILADIRGFQYQPYTATNAVLDPATELGDGITVNNVYGGIYTNTTKYGGQCRATVSAPEEKQLNHEFPYVEKQERKVTRSLRSLTAELKVQAGLISAEVAERKSDVESINAMLEIQSGQIEAKVSKTGGSASSFGWVLDDSSWTIKASSADILKATKDGLEVYGKITATSGKIGGFAIEANYLSYNNQTWGGTNTTGIYIGPSGIQLGKNFKVDSSGNLSAASGTFSGYVKAGNIQYGGSSGYFSGSGISSGSIYGGSGGKIAGSTLSTYNLTGGVNTSLGYADWSYGALNGWNKVSLLSANSIVTRSLEVNNRSVSWKSKSFVDGNGDTVYINYLGG